MYLMDSGFSFTNIPQTGSLAIFSPSFLPPIQKDTSITVGLCNCKKYNNTFENGQSNILKSIKKQIEVMTNSY
jgi:hypothetical protein